MTADTASLDRWRQARIGVPPQQQISERRARLVLGLTLATMVGELIAGALTGSMALTADGWHMGSHAAALGITAFGYAYARRHATSERFSFGTGKVSALAGYSGALLLAVVAVLMAVESVERLLDPVGLHFDEAIAVAVIGLTVNLVSAVLLGGGHTHGHDHAHGGGQGHPRDHDHDHDHDHEPADDHGAPQAASPHVHVHHDHNLRAAYLHVIADALTSVLAIVALAGGKWLGWVWLDPCTAIVASGLIAWWAWGLMRSSGHMLLDAEENSELRRQIVRLIEADADNIVADLRMWRIGVADFAAIVSVVTHHPRSAEYYKGLISHLATLRHVTVEVFSCPDAPCDLHRVG
jgi:cation diffusion facilitator family transporter